MSAQIHCTVLETPAHEWIHRGGQSHRELLPWADPYIALLMQRLEARFDAEQDEVASIEPSEFHPLDADDSPWPMAEGDDWYEDAFVPLAAERLSPSRLPAVYGGWPLLDDVQESYDDRAY